MLYLSVFAVVIPLVFFFIALQVSDSCSAFCTFRETTEDEQESPADAPDSSFVLLVSGLEFGATLVTTSSEGEEEVTPLELSTQMLADFVSGRLGGQEHVSLASRITR